MQPRIQRRRWMLAALVFLFGVYGSTESYADGRPRPVKSSSEWVDVVGESIQRFEAQGFAWAVVEFTIASITSDLYVSGQAINASEIQPHDLVVHAGALPASARLTTPVAVRMHPVHGVVTVGGRVGPAAQYWVVPGDRVMVFMYGLAEDSPLRDRFSDTADIWTAWLVGQLHEGQLSVVSEVTPDYEPVVRGDLARRDLSVLMSQVRPTSWAGPSIASANALERIRHSVLEVTEQ